MAAIDHGNNEHFQWSFRRNGTRTSEFQTESPPNQNSNKRI